MGHPSRFIQSTKCCILCLRRVSEDMKVFWAKLLLLMASTSFVIVFCFPFGPAAPPALGMQICETSTKAHLGPSQVPWPRCPRAYAELSSCLLWTLDLGQECWMSWAKWLKGAKNYSWKEGAQSRPWGRPVASPDLSSLVLSSSKAHSWSGRANLSSSPLKSSQSKQVTSAKCWLLAQGLCIILSVSMQYLQLPSVRKYCSA